MCCVHYSQSYGLSKLKFYTCIVKKLSAEDIDTIKHHYIGSLPTKSWKNRIYVRKTMLLF